MIHRIGDSKDYLEYHVRHDGCVEVLNVQVGTDRRKGIGRMMVNQMLEKLPPNVRTVYAIARSSNFIAQQFWESQKFRSVPLRGFYKDEPLVSGANYVDAIMYVRDVKSCE